MPILGWRRKLRAEMEELKDFRHLEKYTVLSLLTVQVPHQHLSWGLSALYHMLNYQAEGFLPSVADRLGALETNNHRNIRCWGWGKLRALPGGSRLANGWTETGIQASIYHQINFPLLFHDWALLCYSVDEMKLCFFLDSFRSSKSEEESGDYSQ